MTKNELLRDLNVENNSVINSCSMGELNVVIYKDRRSLKKNGIATKFFSFSIQIRDQPSDGY